MTGAKHNSLSSNKNKPNLSRNFKKQKRNENRTKKLNALIELGTRNGEVTEKSGLSGKKRKKKSKRINDSGEPERKRLRKDVQYLLNGQEQTNEVVPVFGILTEEQKLYIRKQLKLRLKKRQERAFLELNEVGEGADLLTPAEKRVPLTTDDFQSFINYVVHPVYTPSPRWVKLLNHLKVMRRVFLVVEGAGLEDYLENEPQLKTLKEFESRLEVVTPLTYGSSLIEELALVPLSNTQKMLLLRKNVSIKKATEAGELFQAFRTMFKIAPKSSEAALESKKNNNMKNKALLGPDKFSRKELLLTPWEMFEENYPLPDIHGDKYKDFMHTRDEYSEITENSPMWAVDCEMCLTTVGSELTRICIIDEAHNVVYESLVKPRNPIVNYLTCFSGITDKMLQDVKVTLEDVQHHIRCICPPDVIFVGQSLNNDLIALKMIHPYVIDTSVIFNLSGIRHRKAKLSVLTEEFLSERIQTGKAGHSPIEDSLAAMKLVQMKLKHSLSWGNAVMCGPRPPEEAEKARELLREREQTGTAHLSGLKDHPEPLSSHVAQLTEQHVLLSKSLFSHITRHNKTVQLVGKQEEMDEWGRFLSPSLKVEVRPVRTSRLVIKVAKASSHDTCIAHVSLNHCTPLEAINKADKLVNKLLRNPQGKTLYTILLAGRPNCPKNGVLFMHLVREHIPLVTLPTPAP